MLRARYGIVLGFVAAVLSGCGESPPTQVAAPPPPGLPDNPPPAAGRPVPTPPADPVKPQPQPKATRPRDDAPSAGARAFAAAEAALARKEYGEAVIRFDDAIELGHRVPAARFGRGLARYEAGRLLAKYEPKPFRQATEEFRAVLAAAPTDAAAKYNLALSLYRSNDFASSAKLFAEVGDKYPAAKEMKAAAQRAADGLAGSEESVRRRQASLDLMKEKKANYSQTELEWAEVEVQMAKVQLALWSWDRAAARTETEAAVALLERMHARFAKAAPDERLQARRNLGTGRITLARLTSDHKLLVAEYRELFDEAEKDWKKFKKARDAGFASQAEYAVRERAMSKARLELAEVVAEKLPRRGLDPDSPIPSVASLADRGQDPPS